MEFITNLLYWLTTGLLVPVVVFLLYYFFKSLILIGRFYGIYQQRMKINVRLNKEIEKENFIYVLNSEVLTEAKSGNNLVQSLNRISANLDKPIMCEKILGDYEISAAKELDKSKFLVKIGPMLGLMGTLIPMGPALVGLAVGDIESMASNMQVAFATTVVGLIIGAIGFITLQVKQRWVADDMNILDYIYESIKNEGDFIKEESKNE